MTEQPVSVSAEDLPATSPQSAAWRDTVQRAEHGETIAVIAHVEHVADVVPSDELDRLRETIEVLSDHDLVRALADRDAVVLGHDAITQLVTQRADRERS
jgi:antitoxin (DNA-binding transcriptional repressor) of toxin-antitoxin stability system